MTNDESIIKRIEGNKADNINRLAAYYHKLYDLGAFIEPVTGAKRDLNEVCNVIQQEMKSRSFTPATVWYVREVLADIYKRAWRHRKFDTTKQGNSSSVVEDDETTSIYDSYLNYINELDNFDYSELPKRLRQNIAERMYKLYRHHDKQWTTHGLQVVKHEDGLSIPDPYAGIIRIERGEPYEGMAVDGIRKHIKLCREIEKKYLIGVMDSSGNRRISLDEEKKLYNAWAALDGYLRPWANDKWKRDLLGWCKIFKHKFKIKSKSGAAKFSRKKIFIDGKDVMRGITREEIDKNQPRLCNAFLEFIEFFPALIDLHSSFEVLAEPVRAVHSVMLHDKLSQSS